MIKIKTHYEVHWASSNCADQMVAFRRGAKKHKTKYEAELEARKVKPTSPDIVPIVCEVK